MKIDPKRLRLYAVTDRAWTHDAEGLLRQVAAAVDGGAGIVQLSEDSWMLDGELEIDEVEQPVFDEIMRMAAAATKAYYEMRFSNGR